MRPSAKYLQQHRFVAVPRPGAQASLVPLIARSQDLACCRLLLLSRPPRPAGAAHGISLWDLPVGSVADVVSVSWHR